MMIFLHLNNDIKGKPISEIEYMVHEDSDIHEVMQEFRRFLLAVSFQPATVDKYIEAN